MPKMLCKCGNVISWSLIPNPIEYLIISDVEYDKYTDVVDADELYSKMKHIMECTSWERF
jgi:hypothetical protein